MYLLYIIIHNGLRELELAGIQFLSFARVVAKRGGIPVAGGIPVKYVIFQNFIIVTSIHTLLLRGREVMRINGLFQKRRF
jgi:hypothetical protein